MPQTPWQQDCDAARAYLAGIGGATTLKAIGGHLRRSTQYTRRLIQAHPQLFALQTDAKSVGSWWVEARPQ